MLNGCIRFHAMVIRIRSDGLNEEQRLLHFHQDFGIASTIRRAVSEDCNRILNYGYLRRKPKVSGVIEQQKAADEEFDRKLDELLRKLREQQSVVDSALSATGGSPASGSSD